MRMLKLFSTQYKNYSENLGLKVQYKQYVFNHDVTKFLQLFSLYLFTEYRGFFYFTARNNLKWVQVYIRNFW
jgi:hypothetical protein